MKVTKIEEISKSRCRVYIDQEFAFVLYKGELRFFHICEEEEIRQEDYEEIMEKTLPKRAKLRAMNLLKGRDHTTRQLYDKLKEGGYPEQVIREALEYVASYHYTDDLRYAEDYITSYEDTRSRKRIEQYLQRKGIEKTVLEKAWQNWEQKGGAQDEDRMIRQLLKKRHYDPETADIRERQRTYGFLMRKGFSTDAVYRALKADRDSLCE